MPDATTLPYYEAYVKNVKDFTLAETDLRRLINKAIKSNKENTIKSQTKLYTLLYSTFSEANFMKMILTPYGFEQNYVDEILAQGSIREKWHKCLEIAFLNFSQAQKTSEVPNKSQEIKRIIDTYIVDPSILRNKIAHGQFTVALNSKATALNPDLTQKLENITFIEVYRWFEINKKLTNIIEDLIESPDKAHFRHYYFKYQNLEKFIRTTSTWTIETKKTTPSMSKTYNRDSN